MYIVVVGHTQLATEFARLVLDSGAHKVVMIIKKKEEATRIGSLLNIAVVNADPTDTKTLDELDLEKCDVFLTATDNEKENVLSALYAKQAGAKKIFVEMETPEGEEILEKLGFIPINAQHLAARTVELMVMRPAVSDLVDFERGAFEMIEVPARQTTLIGKEIGKAKGDYFHTLATYNNGEYYFSKDVKIKENDTLLLLVLSEQKKKAEKEFMNSIVKKLFK